MNDTVTPGAGGDLPDLALCQALLATVTLDDCRTDPLASDALTRVLTRAVLEHDGTRLPHITFIVIDGRPGVTVASSWPKPKNIDPERVRRMRLMRRAAGIDG